MQVRHLAVAAILLIAACTGDDPSVTTATRAIEVAPSDTIGTGARFTCAVVGAGSVRCWGRNLDGQLGNGTTSMSTTPVVVTGIDDAVAVAVGWSHACALHADGRVSCWGTNTNGQIGTDPALMSRSTIPREVPGLTDVVQVTAGNQHTCARLANGSAKCWGKNTDLQLGHGSGPGSHVPAFVTTGSFTVLADVRQIAAGGYHTCARLGDGAVRCWGRNDDGQVGSGVKGGDVATAAVGLASGESAVSLATGFAHSCAVLSNGEARCWGADAYGQLGYSTSNADEPTPVPVRTYLLFDGGVGNLTAISAVAGGYQHTCVWTSWGPWCAGNPGDGRLGFSATGNVHLMRLSHQTEAVAIATGGFHTCIKRPSGTVACFGSNNYGQLGNGTTAASWEPVDAFVDDDGDGLEDRLEDNCPTVANADQLDTDVDGIGDACECLDVTCVPPDPCYGAGSCIATTGECEYELATACEAPPAWPANASLDIDELTPTSVTVSWPEATHELGVAGYDLYLNSDLVAAVDASVRAQAIDGLSPDTGYVVRVEARNSGGAASTDGPAKLVHTPLAEPDPTAPPLGNGPATSIHDAVSDLHTGPGKTQFLEEDPALDIEIDPERIALIRGLVYRHDNKEPLDGVRVSIQDHPEVGVTHTDASGRFSLVVNGGGSLIVRYDVDGYLPVQRRVVVPYHDYAWAEDVAMMEVSDAAYDYATTHPIYAEQAGYQRIYGKDEADADGARRAVILVPPATQIGFLMPDGTTDWQPSDRPLTAWIVEYTVGEDGPEAMPGEIAPPVAYTWAAEFIVQEAEEAGAEHVVFSQPVYLYTDNFLGFEVGSPMPYAYWDRGQAAWIPEPSGRVIAMTGEDTSGMLPRAIIDPGADPLDIPDGERIEVADLYDPGKQLWRTPLSRFSPGDCNMRGVCRDCRSPRRAKKRSERDCDYEESGSIIECTNRSLREEIGLPGTGLSLAYNSARSPGNRDAYRVQIPLTDDTMPETCISVQARIRVAGRLIQLPEQPCTPGETVEFEWDGRDWRGREVRGEFDAVVAIGWRFGVDYAPVPLFGQSSTICDSSGGIPCRADGSGCECQSSARGSSSMIWWAVSRVKLGTVKTTPADSIGGWSLDVHHRLDRQAKKIHLGDGTRSSYEAAYRVAQLHLPKKLSGDDAHSGPVAVEADGSVLFSTAVISGYAQVYRLPRGGGEPELVAGCNCYGAWNEGGLATEGFLPYTIRDLAVGRDGSIYIAAGNVVRVVDPSGIIRTPMGSFWPSDAGPMPPYFSDYGSYAPTDIAVSSDGSIYVVSGSSSGDVTRRAPDGSLEEVQLDACEYKAIWAVELGRDDSIYYACETGIHRRTPTADTEPVATKPNVGSCGSDSVMWRPSHLAVSDRGTLFYAAHRHTYNAMARTVYRVDEGVVTRVAGDPCTLGASGDGDSPMAAMFRIDHLAATPDGKVIVRQNNSGDSSAPSSIRIIEDIEDATAVPAPGGGAAYVFDAAGRHLATVNAVTGQPIYTFEYDDDEQLERIIDAFGNTVTIERDTLGRPTGIVGPFGHRTGLAVHGNGYLSRVTSPTGEYVDLTYYPNGLLEQFITPAGDVSSFIYDTAGRLMVDDHPAPFGGKVLAQPDLTTTTVTTELGQATQYKSRTVEFEDVCRIEDDGDVVCDEDCLPDSGGGLYPCTKDEVIAANGVRFESEVSELGLGLAEFRDPDGSRLRVLYGIDPHLFTRMAQRTVATSELGYTAIVERNKTVERLDPSSPIGLASSTETMTLKASSADPGRTWTSAYDGSAMSSTVMSPMGRTATSFLDEHGRVLQEHVPGVALDVFYTYDARGRLVSVSQGDRRTEYVYRTDADGGTLWKVRSLDDDGTWLETEYAVDDASRVTGVIYPDGASMGFGYDDDGNVDRITPPGQPMHQTTFGPKGLPTLITPPVIDADPRRTTHKYDADMRLYETTAADGSVGQAIYDPTTGELTQLVYPDGSVKFMVDESDPARRIAAVERIDAIADTRFDLDYDGQTVISTTWGPTPGTAIVMGTVAYDESEAVSASRVTELINGAPIVYQHDADDVLVAAGDLAIARVDGSSAVDLVSIGSLEDDPQLTPYGELWQRAVTLAGSSLYSAEYEYDRLGRVKSVTETIEGAPRTRAYTYDARGRLETVSTSAGGLLLATYLYDDNDNRIAGPGVAPDDVVIDDLDQMLRYGNLHFEYTLEGEVDRVTDVSTGAETNYEYDSTGSLRRVVLPSDDLVEYVVDGADRRIARIVNGTVSHRWLWGRAGVTAEVDATGAVTARYVYGLSHTPAYILRDGKRYAIITDRRGSPILVVDVDATGPTAVVQRRTYDEWGCITSETGLADLHPFGFAGGLHDPATGLTQFGAREYDCRIGRWTSLDPISFGDGGNRYAYAGADPINFIDPTGLYRANHGWLTGVDDWLTGSGAGNAVAGFGDKVSFGITDSVRDALDLNDVIDKCSAAYRAGAFVGELWRDAIIGHGALKALKFARGWKGIKRVRLSWKPRFEVADRVAGQLADPRLGHLAGKISPRRLQALASNPNALRFLDTATGHTNVVQLVEGRLMRITIANGKRIISVGPMKRRGLFNGIANGRFDPLP